MLGRLFGGSWPHLASAYISGISVGMLVRSPEFWPYALCAALSITSKYVLRVDGRHIWNPSNLGIVAMLVLASDTVASLSVQWGNNLLPMVVVWCFGAVIIHRLGRFHITLTYVALVPGLLRCVRAAVTGHPWLAEVAPITGPMYQLYIFFMITDPKTTVHAEVGPVPRGLPGGGGGGGPAPVPVRARAVLRALHRRSGREPRRDRARASRRARGAGPTGRGLRSRSTQVQGADAMADATVIANQKSILKNQAGILANQKSDRSANQGRILANQGKLDTVLANQKTIKANQATILANQKTILAK